MRRGIKTKPTRQEALSDARGRRVRQAIKQEPYLGFNALGDVYLAGLTTAPAEANTPPPSANAARLSEAAEAWDRTKGTTSILSLEAFIRRFGDTYYRDLAKVRLRELKQTETAKQVVVPAKEKANEENRPIAPLSARDRQIAKQAEYDAWERGASGLPVRWRNPQSGSYGEVVSEVPFEHRGTFCRNYHHKMWTTDGREQQMRGRACRNADGSWTST